MFWVARLKERRLKLSPDQFLDALRFIRAFYCIPITKVLLGGGAEILWTTTFRRSFPSPKRFTVSRTTECKQYAILNNTLFYQTILYFQMCPFGRRTPEAFVVTFHKLCKDIFQTWQGHSTFTTEHFWRFQWRHQKSKIKLSLQWFWNRVIGIWVIHDSWMLSKDIYFAEIEICFNSYRMNRNIHALVSRFLIIHVQYFFYNSMW